MLARALSGTVFGLDGVRVEVEADIADGLPGFHIVGLGDRALQEARERVKIAINNSGFEFPGRKVTINLAPAQLPKEGSGFDLAMAAAIVNAAQDRGLPADAAWLGELALDGAVRPIRGTLPIIAHLDRLGIRRFYVPTANVAEAKIATAAPVIGVNHFRQLKVHWDEAHRLTSRRRLSRRNLPHPRITSTWPRSSASPTPSAPWRSPPPGRIISYWWGRRVRARRCWPGRSPASCLRSARGKPLR